MEWVKLLLLVLIVVFVGIVLPVFRLKYLLADTPKIIHQTAPADQSKWHPVWFECQKSWKEKFPNYEYKMWTDEDLDELIRTKYSWFYPTYQGYDLKIKRIDSARYFILNEYGGIYADMDFECVNNFEHVLIDDKVFIAESPWKNGPSGETHQNALMISPAKHPFWTKVFGLLDKRKNEGDVLFTTGPRIIMEALQNDTDVVSLPYEKFAPQHSAQFTSSYESGRKTLTPPEDPSIFTRHHSTSVWNNY
jgi:mannosyltransferase OCH1-like enzyme